MAAAKVDIDINEAETFEMAIEFWENQDLTIPIDLTGWVFTGAFSFSDRCIPMVFTTIDNSITARIEADQLLDLPAKGTYSIESDDGTDTLRVQQGSIRVDGNSVCTSL